MVRDTMHHKGVRVDQLHVPLVLVGLGVNLHGHTEILFENLNEVLALLRVEFFNRTEVNSLKDCQVDLLICFGFVLADYLRNLLDYSVFICLFALRLECRFCALLHHLNLNLQS